MKREDIQRINHYLALWLAEIATNNAVDFFDINKTSEDLSARLLNSIYGLHLKNLNHDRNYPGIDLGDQANKIAFQVTSRTDSKKILSNLTQFAKTDCLKYSNGIKFLLLSYQKKPFVPLGKTQGVFPNFDPQTDVITLKDLTREIFRIYDDHPSRFKEVLSILECEFGEKPPTTNTPKRWHFLRWEVDIRIENIAGDTEYQTAVMLKNISKKCCSESPVHSVWSSTAPEISTDDIRAYSNSRTLKIDKHLSTVTGSYTAFKILSDKAIKPDSIWRYWFEISWPRGFPQLLVDEQNFLFKGESDVDELVIKLVMPKGVSPLGCPFLKEGKSKMQKLYWTKIHGRDSIALCMYNIKAGGTFAIVFRLTN